MPPSPQQGQSDDSMGIIWLIAGILAGLGIIWYLFKAQIIKFYFYLKLFEINYFIGLFTNRLDDVRTFILNAFAKGVTKLSYEEVVNVGAAVGEYVRYPLIILIILMAVAVYLASTTRTFKRFYSMREMVNLEKQNWPQITPVAGLDLVKTDIDKGPWAMALTPMQFCKRHHLLLESRVEQKEGMLRSSVNQVEVSLRRGEANRVFALQLGPMWRGVKKTPPHVQALFAAFAARINADSKGAQKLFTHINQSSASRLDFTGTEELLKKHADTPIVKQIEHAHGWLLTVMAEMLLAARSDGVQATADFLWLKPVDRRLWYMLNTVGRQTPFVEVAGPFAHWMAEKEAGRKLVVPMVEEATRALEIAIKEIIYKPESES